MHWLHPGGLNEHHELLREEPVGIGVGGHLREQLAPVGVARRGVVADEGAAHIGLEPIVSHRGHRFEEVVVVVVAECGPCPAEDRRNLVERGLLSCLAEVLPAVRCRGVGVHEVPAVRKIREHHPPPDQ
jgi:hypothetical protein